MGKKIVNSHWTENLRLVCFTIHKCLHLKWPFEKFDYQDVKLNKEVLVIHIWKWELSPLAFHCVLVFQCIININISSSRIEVVVVMVQIVKTECFAYIWNMSSQLPC